MIFLLACTESFPSWTLPGPRGTPAETDPVLDSAATGTSAADTGTQDTNTLPVDTSLTDTAPVDTAPPEDTAPDETVVVDPCAESWGRLSGGEEVEIGVDDHTGDEDTTEPKEDAHDGADGDEPRFARHNVARAHCTSRCYWYSSSHQESGEPDPDGEQWVDYLPDFASEGVGWYTIRAVYRQSENRADYEAVYRIVHRDGTSEVLQDQREGSDYVEITLGSFWMCPGSYVRVEDVGDASITFNEMEFERG